MTSTTSAPETQVQRHPIRGGLYGISLGIGVAIYLILFAVTPFRISTLVTIVVIGAVVGIAWGLLAPAKRLDGVPASASAFGTTFTRSDDVDHGPAATYEQEFGVDTESRDDGAFGAPAPDDRAFGAPPPDGSAFGAPAPDDPRAPDAAGDDQAGA